MDSVTTEHKPEVDDRFDTARITAAVDALAEKHHGREDTFRTAVSCAGRDHPHPVFGGDPPSLPLADPERRRAHGGGRDRRLWPRPDGAGIRHRSALHPALQADRVGRAGRRSYSLLPL